jgi:dolichol kinase
MGALVGKAYGRHKVFDKTYEGAFGCFVACLVWASAVAWVAHVPWTILVSGALAATIVEALPIPLDDNLGMTLAAGYTMKLLLS